MLSVGAGVYEGEEGGQLHLDAQPQAAWVADRKRPVADQPTEPVDQKQSAECILKQSHMLQRARVKAIDLLNSQ